MSRRVIRMPEISQKTGQSVNTLHYLRSRNEGPPMFRLGRHVVAYEDEIDRYIEEQSTGPTATGRSRTA